MITFFGIDISKSSLEEYIRPDGITMRFSNTYKGIQSFLTILTIYGVSMNARVFFEKYDELRTYIRPVCEENIFWPRWCIRSLLVLYIAKVSMNHVANQDLKKLYDSIIHLYIIYSSKPRW